MFENRVSAPQGSGDGEFPAWKAQWDIAQDALEQLYGGRPDFPLWLRNLQERVLGWRDCRHPDLRALDKARGDPTAWIQAPGQVGYSFYVDRFAGTLQGVASRLPYLKDLGVTYLHPLPLSRARPGDSDGGFAVVDFCDVEPALGTIEDLRLLADALHRDGMALILDVVCNHTAAEHAWAVAARSGDPAYLDYYHVVPTRSDVDAYEATLSDVFPDTAPGNFTWSPELSAWVWTTFREFQWDLNYANPAVFAEMLEVLLRLSDLGVDGFRLDSTPFLWKRIGTNCRNLPECHLVLRAWRALVSIVAPSVVFKAEAIESIDSVLPYFGNKAAPECNLAYGNTVMAALWASLALKDARPARRLIAAAETKPPQATWLNYIRCHDDLIWSTLSPYLPADSQRWVSSFFCGNEPGSYANGSPFQTLAGKVPSTTGMAADLCGVGRDPLGLARLKLLYGVCYALDGLPVIYMGDEIALANDPDFGQDEARASDGRWLHRPPMDWDRAANRTAPSGAVSEIFNWLRRLKQVKGQMPAFHGAIPARRLELRGQAVLAFARDGSEPVICAANFTDSAQIVQLETLGARPSWRDLISEETGLGVVTLDPYQVRWLVHGG